VGSRVFVGSRSHLAGAGPVEENDRGATVSPPMVRQVRPALAFFGVARQRPPSASVVPVAESERDVLLDARARQPFKASLERGMPPTVAVPRRAARAKAGVAQFQVVGR
jgi:hypothetical protein